MTDSNEWTTVDDSTDTETTEAESGPPSDVTESGASDATELGIDQELEAAIAYFGTFLTGLPIGLLFLVIEQDNDFVRFHSLQSTFVFGAGAIGGVLLGIVGAIFGILTLGFGAILIIPVALLGAALFVVVQLYAGWKALQGERYRIPYVADYADRYV